MDETGLSIPLPVTGGDAAQEDKELLASVLGSVGSAVRRMRCSQHQDGGWGQQVERSSFWYTAYAVLFLRAAQDLPLPEGLGDIGAMLERGMVYLERRPNQWAADVLSVVPGISIYETGLMGRCFYRAGRAYVRRESALRIYRSIDRLYHSQNNDGGWDANLWGYEIKTPIYIWSEVGATSIVLQALAETREERFGAVVSKGMKWLATSQNVDGSWNDGSCHPNLAAYQLTGQPSFTKTCDALQGILVGRGLGISLDPFQKHIDLGLHWLRRQQPLGANQLQWPADDQSQLGAADYEKVCLFLETLLLVPEASLPELSAYVNWLLCRQHRRPDDPEDGAWILAHTARIGLALAQFYCRVYGPQTHPAGAESPLPWIL